MHSQCFLSEEDICYVVVLGSGSDLAHLPQLPTGSMVIEFSDLERLDEISPGQRRIIWLPDPLQENEFQFLAQFVCRFLVGIDTRRELLVQEFLSLMAANPDRFKFIGKIEEKFYFEYGISSLELPNDSTFKSIFLLGRSVEYYRVAHSCGDSQVPLLFQSRSVQSSRINLHLSPVLRATYRRYGHLVPKPMINLTFRLWRVVNKF